MLNQFTSIILISFHVVNQQLFNCVKYRLVINYIDRIIIFMFSKHQKRNLFVSHYTVNGYFITTKETPHYYYLNGCMNQSSLVTGSFLITLITFRKSIIKSGFVLRNKFSVLQPKKKSSSSHLSNLKTKPRTEYNKKFTNKETLYINFRFLICLFLISINATQFSLCCMIFRSDGLQLAFSSLLRRQLMKMGAYGMIFSATNLCSLFTYSFPYRFHL